MQAAKSVTEQTQDVLKTIDSHLAKAGTDKSKLLSATIYITDMKIVPGDECGVGTPGCRRAIRRRAPPSKPSWRRRSTTSRSWWSRLSNFGDVILAARGRRNLQGAPHRVPLFCLSWKQSFFQPKG
jgi:hypothetical protein